MKKKLVIGGVILVAIIIGWKVTRPKTDTTSFQTAQAEKTTLVSTVTSSGQVISNTSAAVNTNASGVVKQVFVKNGDKVKTGQKIAELELDIDGRQRYLQALASYQSAKNSLESARININTLQASLFAANQKFINDAVARELDETDPTYIQENATWLAAEASYKNQQNVITQVQTSVSSAYASYQQNMPTIVAPISGMITGFSLQPGMVINAGTTTSGSSAAQKIASILTEATPAIELNLTEVDVVKIEVGDKATVTFDAISDKSFTGKVVSIDRIGSVSSGVTTYPTVIVLDVGAPEVLANMAAQAAIITEVKDNVVVVPSEAVVAIGGQRYVRIMKNGRMEQVGVEVGSASDTQTEIVSGVKEGDIVVTSVAAERSTSTSGTSGSSVFGGLNRGFGGSGAVRITR